MNTRLVPEHEVIIIRIMIIILRTNTHTQILTMINSVMKNSQVTDLTGSRIASNTDFNIL